ncbi:NADH-cytochrome b5 reductase [Coemansia reversa NRRL 1564]|uniref:NADH-cytochrome b5 reductase n=1 Tax=Coemansia reversa (strain ATCC 12441 / NRRL 1564) TaxID=763665 RepID=A0A2G5BA50_COERN|nr:NADH-cytochrome b5 reductase [Coemansia reversa NRRL 1564]|eukprot:PIA15883.1 NADH-cytochrome b5 reductase [Coemansia reversa NRRL 1564]
MFSTLRVTVPRQFSRAYSTAPAGGKNGNNILWASIATGAVLVGGYYYTRSKEMQASSIPATKALDPSKFTPFTLKEKVPINHDTSRFRFALGTNEELGLDITSCLVVKAKLDNDEKATIRPYTPVSPQHARGYFDLVIKDYPQGKMSSHIHGLSPGETIEIKGPIPKFPYKADAFKEIGMVAGGSGITPMVQLIQHVLEDPNDHTKLTLIFANKSEDDIILRSTLDEYAKKHPDQFNVHYVVDKAASGDWKGGVGFVTKEMIQKYLPASSQDDVLVSVCGPPPMMKSVSGPKAPDYSQGEVSGLFKELGYTSKQVFKF